MVNIRTIGGMSFLDKIVS